MRLSETPRRTDARLVLAAAVLAGVLGLTGHAHADDWGAVMRLRSGERIRMQLIDAPSVSGTLVSVAPDTVTLMIRGTQSVATREQVRRVDRDRAVPRSLPWLGMVVGAAWLGSEVAREGDFTALGRAFWTGVGAAIGGVSGAVARRVTRFSPVYRETPREGGGSPDLSARDAGARSVADHAPEGLILPSRRSTAP